METAAFCITMEREMCAERSFMGFRRRVMELELSDKSEQQSWRRISNIRGHKKLENWRGLSWFQEA